MYSRFKTNCPFILFSFRFSLFSVLQVFHFIGIFLIICCYSSWCESPANLDLLLRGFTWGKYWLIWKHQATRKVVYFVSWDAYLTCIYLAGVKLRFMQFLSCFFSYWLILFI